MPIAPRGSSWDVQVEPRSGEPVGFARQLDKEHGQAVLKHPSKGVVSLRAQARDGNGNTVEQTIMRAYRLK